MAKSMSLKPSDMAAGGGGILNDVNVIWHKPRFGLFDYVRKDGTVVTKDAPCFLVDITDKDTGEETMQPWSVGNPQDYVPAKNGKTMITEKPLRASSNMGMLWASLANAIGEEEFGSHVEDDDVTVLDGLECHMVQVPTKRDGEFGKKKKSGGKEYEPTVPVVDVVHKLPWDKDAKSNKAGKSDKPDVAVETIASDFLLKVVADGTEGAKNEIALKAFQELDADEATKTAVSTLLFDDEFIEGVDGVVLDNGVVKAG